MATEEQFSWAKAGNFISGARKMAEDLVPGLLAPGGQALEKVVTGGVQKVKEVIGKPAVGEKPAAVSRR